MSLKECAEIGAKLTNLPARFVCAWWYAENGENWPSTNNPGNISYQGKGIPSGGVFDGVTFVHENKVVEYDTPEDGIKAWAELLKAPDQQHGGMKALSLDLATLEAFHGDVEAMAKAIGESNWAESHYDDGQGPGSLILDAYHNSIVTGWFAPAPEPEPEHTPEPSVRRAAYVAHAGDTFTRIALNYRAPVAIVERLNPGELMAGEHVTIPRAYKVRPGDTLSAIARKTGVSVEHFVEVNRINPDRIMAGEVLFY